MTAPAPAPPLTSRARTTAVLVLFMATFMDLLDTTIVNVALPSIQADLEASSAQLEWIVSGYVLAFAVVLITTGRLGDIHGRKKVFLIGVAGFTLASAAAGLAPTADVLVISRLVQGLFAATMVPQVLSIIQVLYAPRERAGVLGAFGAVTGTAAVAGPLLGGILTTYDVLGLEWRSIFVINIPVGIVLLVAGAILIPESHARERVRLDLRGAALISVALFLAVFALIEGRPEGWPVWIWAMLTVSIVLLVVFVLAQRRLEAAGGAPLVPPTLFRDRGFSAGMVTAFAFFGSIGAYFFVIVIYLQVGLGFTPIGAAVSTLPFSIGAFLASGASVPLVAKLGKGLVFVGLVAFASAVAWTGQTVAHHGDALGKADLIGPMLLGGAGLAFAAIPLLDVALANIDVRYAGAASGVFGTFQQVGAALLLAVVGVVFFETAGTVFSPAVLRDALLTALWVPGVSLGVAALASLLLPSVAAVRRHKELADALDLAAVAEQPA
ncbi:MFS transporter [Nocardioides psychrotolerans]|uniref:MFS transporter n=1 Tax=Nocardioides psychrotolerans TaxID=1005945 RepID=UPI0011929170|nr:MFS transporter [Nocardioides psychrotolerans]GEP37553.1 MFS transporter [Nocardioides psychrotolerans]